MKKQASVWLIVSFLILAVGIVYALSTSTPPQPGGSAKTSPQTQSTVTPTPERTTELAMSPDLSKVDAYEFLDPVPTGKPAPNFTAQTAQGKTIHLSDFKGKKNVVLVFYSGSFCSVCGAQLTNLQNHLTDYKTQDAEIIAISADDKAHAMESVGEHGLSFNVVPDADKKLIKQFGVSNISKGGMAWPSLFIVDKKGIVQLSYASKEGHRLHSNEILPKLSKITGKPAPRLDYEQ